MLSQITDNSPVYSTTCPWEQQLTKSPPEYVLLGLYDAKPDDRMIHFTKGPVMRYNIYYNVRTTVSLRINERIYECVFRKPKLITDTFIDIKCIDKDILSK